MNCKIVLRLCTKSCCLSRSPLCNGIKFSRSLCTLFETIMGPSVTPTISVTFLSNGNTLSPKKSLIIGTAHKSYLINAPEGLSRVLQESGPKLSKICHIFVTGNQWELLGGLIGTCLSIHSSGRQSVVNLHGPPIIHDVGNLMTKFSDTLGMKLAYSHTAEYSDDVFQVSSLALRSASGNLESYCYLFKPNPLPAKLDIIKAVRMEFPVAMLKDGVTAKRLKDGEVVELPDGRRFDGKDYLIQPVQSKSILLIDCATPEMAEQLTASGQLKRWLGEETGGDSGIDIAVHLAGPELLRCSQYQAVVDLFKGSQIKHVVMDGRNTRPALYAPYQCQLMLNSLHERIFPLLYGHKFMIRESDERPEPDATPLRIPFEAKAEAQTSGQLATLGFPDSAVSCEVSQEYHVRPPHGFADAGSAADAPESGGVEPFAESAMREKLFEDHEIYITREEYSSRMSEYAARRARFEPGPVGLERPYPWVQFLGTASSNPIKFRNVSSILLHLEDNAKLLLDCGEGTLLQLLNFYGQEECQAVLRSIRAVCISHMHLDHTSGIFALLKARRAAFAAVGVKQPPACAFVGPRGFSRWLEFFTSQQGGCGLGEALSPGTLQLFWCEILCGMSSPYSNITDVTSRFADFTRSVFGLEKITVVPVAHSTRVAFGFAIQGRGAGGKPWKIVYSGDTIPCRSLVEAGMNCDLLIHEATFEDGLEHEALGKKHSTAGQAISQATEMRARHAILTHFSTRYTCAVPMATLPTEDRPLGNGVTSVGFAHDHMCASLLDLPLLPRLTPMLPCVLPKHFFELERRSGRFKPVPAPAQPSEVKDGSSAAAFSVNRTAKRQKRDNS